MGIPISSWHLPREVPTPWTECGSGTESHDRFGIAQFHVTMDPSFRTVKDDKFDQQWQLKAGFLTGRKEQQPRESTSNESIYPKRPASEPKRASLLLTQKSKKHKPDSPHNGGNPPDTHQREGDQLQQPPDDSYDGHHDSVSPIISKHNIGQTSDEVRNESSSEDPSASHKVESQQNPEPARDIIKAMQAMVKVMEAELSMAPVGDVQGELFSFQALFPNYAGYPEKDPIQVYKATVDPDTMYHHQAMKQPDAEQFRKAMQREWNDQLKNKISQ